MIKNQFIVKYEQQYPIPLCFQPIYQVKTEIQDNNSINPNQTKPFKQKRKYTKCDSSKMRKSVGSHVGHWNQQENKKYYIFLSTHRKKFEEKFKRRSEKIFRSMARFVVTRVPDQCRSHHQKMEKKYQTLDCILQYFRNHYGFQVTQKNNKKVSQKVPFCLKQQISQRNQTYVKQQNTEFGDMQIKIEELQNLSNELRQMQIDTRQVKNEYQQNIIKKEEKNSQTLIKIEF